jgi:hypothetical protein
MKLRPTRGAALILCGAGLLLFAGFLAMPPATAHGTPRRLALLVGCTHYEHPGVPELYGPANDVPLFANVLRSQFGFAEDDITQLVGWPSDERRRPTRANIGRAFEDLIARAGEGTQVVILMAGHGVQVPIPETQVDPLDPKNPEPDGLDEVFLPADVRTFGRDGLENGIPDDQFGIWLDRLRDKGAAVWIVFDCCHAGDMIRGDVDTAVERPRSVPVNLLGVRPEQIEHARTRVREAAVKQGRKDLVDSAALAHNPLPQSSGGKAKGSVVAFYAALPFESAPELPRPDDAPRTREHYYGLLTFTLASLLRQNHRPMTYRELSQALLARYDAERGARGPTPAFDGDLDCQVLGTEELPALPLLVLERSAGRFHVSAGLLRGVTVGSILAVHPPAGDADDAVLGFVRVVRATADRAEVVPCPAADGGPAADPNRLPNRGRCELVTRDLGDMRLKVFVRAASAQDQPGARLVRRALEQIDPTVGELFELARDEAVADWVFRVDNGELRLHCGAGMAVLVEDGAARKVYANYHLPMPTVEDAATGLGPARVSVRGAAADLGALSGQLAHDLQVIFTWRNVWRVAGSAAAEAGAAPARAGLRIEVHKVKVGTAGQPALAEPLRSGVALLPPPDDGIPIRLDLTNDTPQHLWVTVLVLQADLSILELRSISAKPLESGKSFSFTEGCITNHPYGKEGFIVLAIPTEDSRTPPDYSFLAQPGLGQKSRGAVHADIVHGPLTPFGQLLKSAVTGKGRRGHDPGAPTNPTVYTWTWLTLPPAASK